MKKARRLIPAGLFILCLLFANIGHAQTVHIDRYAGNPNDCAILASEVASRMLHAGCWARIIELHFVTDKGSIDHAMVAWQPPGSSHIALYDNLLLGGSVQLDETEHDANKIAVAFMIKAHVLILGASFWE